MGKKPSLNIFRCKIRYIFMVFMYLCLANSQAQVHTFVHTYQDWGAGDIVEDHKNGYLLLVGYNSVRIDRHGNKLWTQNLASEIVLQTEKDSNSYFQFGTASEQGGVFFNKLDYEGNLLEYNFIFTQNKNDSQITPRDVIYDKKRDQFIACGSKTRYLSSKGQFWIAGFDKHGKIVWQNSWFDKGQSRYFKRILPIKSTGGYLLLAGSNEDSDYAEIFTTDSMGRLKSRYFVDSCYHIDTWIKAMEVYDIQPYRDSLFLLSAYRKYCNRDRSYFILNKNGKTIRKISNKNFSMKQLPLKNGNILISGGDGLTLLDTNFNIIWMREKIFGEHPNHDITMQHIHHSSDGGFYGIAAGESHDWDPDKDLTFVFKTDSLGFIHHSPKYNEWDQPLMLIPNPASKNVRIAIPYYYGRIEAKFYDMQGKFIFKESRNDTEPFDISTLPSGLYMVEAINLETQASRKMKLVVD